MIGVAHPAAAQHIEGSHQVRAGFFASVDGARFNFDDPLSARAAGLGLGATGGLEWIRPGGLVMGIEMDIGSRSGNRAVDGSVPPIRAVTNYAITLRGRLGHYMRPDMVVYATAGLGALGSEIYADDATRTPKAHATHFGGVFGGGLEYHRGSTIFFLEALHGRYGNRDVTLAGDTYRYKLTTTSIRLGVKFKLGHDWRDGYHSSVK